MHLFSYWDSWFPFWANGLWLLVPLIMVAFCIVGMFFCGRMCCGGAGMPWCSRDNRTQVGETPLDIAKRRYAQGEITKEQYEDIRRTLG